MRYLALESGFKMNTGVYYFWISRTYPWGDIGRSITQWVYVGLNNHLCPEGQKAFAAQVNRPYKKPWGYVCSSSSVKTTLIKSPEVKKHLKLVEKAIKDQAQLHELAMHLRPLEQEGYWSNELHALLEEYLETENRVFNEGLKRKCDWLVKFIEENDIDLVREGVQFRVTSYARGTDKRVNVNMPYRSTIDKKAEWVMRRVSIKPKKNRSTDRRIQKMDVVLYYPVFKVLLPKIDNIVRSLAVEEKIIERWGSL